MKIYHLKLVHLVIHIFENQRLKKIESQEVPEGRTITFEKEAFKGCESLNEIDLRVYGTVYVDERAFQNNKLLSRVYIEAREKVHVGNYAFV